jgi:hypothetical protein
MSGIYLTPAQRVALEAIARRDVLFVAVGGHYRRRERPVAVRTDTMKVLIGAGLAQRPAAGRSGPVEITAAGREMLAPQPV